MRYISLVLLCVVWLVPALANAEGGMKLRHMTVNLSDKASVQRGAKVFANYCMSCHSVKAMRYKQLLPGLGITVKQLQKNLMLPGSKIGDRMTVAMTAKEGKQFFGVAPPDLSEINTIRGPDWLYTYLTSFYLDPSRPRGVNNVVFPKVAMPDVVWKMQGLQKPVYKTIKDANGTTQRVIVGLKQVTKGTMTPKQYDATVRDLVNYLAYISAPYEQQSHHVGYWIILLLVLFTISSWFLKREYWKDIDH